MTNISIIDALNEPQETDRVDFKKSLDIRSRADWAEIIKDIIAMANSGGGFLIIGLNDDGTHSGFDVTPIINYDPADVTNKIHSYTDKHFSSFRIHKSQKDGRDIPVFEIGPSVVPIVFTSPGNYQIADGKQKTAFHIGVVYFRHGAKSEPGTTDDLAQFIERQIDRVKESWLSGIRKVVEAPPGSHFVVVSENATVTNAAVAQEFRLVDDPNAPPLFLKEEDFRKNHPFDYNQLTSELKTRYVDFSANDKYHKIRRPLESSSLYCVQRELDPGNPRTQVKRYYSRAILKEFDKHYKRRQEQEAG